LASFARRKSGSGRVADFHASLRRAATRVYSIASCTGGRRAAGRRHPYYVRHTYASFRIAEQRLSLQEIAEELGHSLEVLAEHYAHVISEYAGKGKIDPERLIREARKQVARGAISRRTGRHMDAKAVTKRSE
jgi:integrase